MLVPSQLALINTRDRFDHSSEYNRKESWPEKGKSRPRLVVMSIILDMAMVRVAT